MSIKTFLTQKLFSSEIDRQVAARMPAAVADPFAEVGFRKLTGAATRELPTMTQDRAIEVAYWLWKTNPLARWIVEITTAFICAEGTPYNTENEEIKKLLDDFWFDPVNRMDMNWDNFVRELEIFGEQCWPAFVAEQTGKVRLGYIDLANIDKVIADPENVKVKIGVIVRGTDGRPEKRYKIVLDGDVEEFLSPAARMERDTMISGQCFYFNANALTNEMRGTGSLFTVADHLDAYEQFLFDSAEKYAQYNAFYYDITVEGADAETLQKERKKYQPPKTGEAFIHNEKVKSEAVAPRFGAMDADTAARLHRNHILGAVGIPEHWYGGGGNVNRATAGEMDAPARKLFTSKQERAKNMLELVFDFVIAQALAARYLTIPEDEAYAYEVQTPEVSEKDIVKLSTMLRDVSTSLTVAQTNNWIDREKARSAFAYFLGIIGYEYDPESIEEVEPGYEDYLNQKSDRNAPLAGDQEKDGAM